jgi:hypothetical protein
MVAPPSQPETLMAKTAMRTDMVLSFIVSTVAHDCWFGI